MNVRIIVAFLVLATATAMPTNSTTPCAMDSFEALSALQNDDLLDNVNMDTEGKPSPCKCKAILAEIRNRIAAANAIGAKCRTNECKVKVAQAVKRLVELRAAVVKRCTPDNNVPRNENIPVEQLDVESLAGDELDTLSDDEELSGRRARVCRVKLAELNKRLRAAMARIPKCKTDACKATAQKAVGALRKAKAALLKRCATGFNACPWGSSLDSVSNENLTGEELDTMDEQSELDGRKECTCRRKLAELNRRIRVTKARARDCNSQACRKAALAALAELHKARATLVKRCTADLADFPCQADVSVEIMDDEELAGEELDNMDVEDELDGRKRCACKARLGELVKRAARNKARAASCKTLACKKATTKAANRIAAALKALKERCGNDDELASVTA